MHSLLLLYRKPEFARCAHLYVAEQTQSLCVLPTKAELSATKQDTKLLALSTVSTIRLVFITVKRTSAFVDRGGNYRWVSCSLDRPPAIIIADQNRSYCELPTKAETTTVNYLSVVDDGRTGYEREPFDPLQGVFCQQENCVPHFR